MKRRIWAAAALAIVGAGTAQAEPPISGMRLQTTYNPATRQVTVVDLGASGRTVLTGQGVVWAPEEPGSVCIPNTFSTPCPPPGFVPGCHLDSCPAHPSSRLGLEPTIEFLPRTDGYDMVLRFENTTATPKSPGSVFVPGIAFGPAVTARDFLADGKAFTVNWGGGVVGANWSYPGGWYAPISFLQDQSSDYMVGISVQYPLMEYQHNLWGSVIRRDWMTYWDLSIELNSWCGGGTQHRVWRAEGDIPPGESRAYRVSVRIMKNSATGHENQWLRLYESYREYFNCNYSYTKYRRDARPMRGDFAAISNSGANCSPSNDHGWLHRNVPGIGQLRLDQSGWGNWVQYLALQNAQGWDRQTLWAPTGVYCTHDCDNFPFQFATHWAAFPNIAASLPILQNYNAALTDSNKQLGLWWGNSVSASRAWDAHDLRRIIPNDGDLSDDNLAFAELDKAAQQGVQVIGLDAFNGMDAWLSYDWLKRLQARQPQIRFCTESIVSDVIHTLAPTYALGTQNGADFRRLTQSHVLADFLNPGHEIWAQINTVHMVGQLGRLPNDDEVRTEMQRLAGLGYVAHPFAAVSLPTGTESELFRAARSWLTSIPQNLKTCPGDFNRCNGVSVQDLFDFLAEWFAKGWKADISDDGVVSVQDLFDFMGHWFSPCGRLLQPGDSGPGGG